MRTIEEYFSLKFRDCFRASPKPHADRYEEQVLSETRGNLRIRLRFSELNSFLEVSEAILIVGEQPLWSATGIIIKIHAERSFFGTIDPPHHAEISSYPEHKHTEDTVAASSHPSVAKLSWRKCKRFVSRVRRKIRAKILPERSQEAASVLFRS